MDLTPTTYTAPAPLKLSPVAPIYDAWHDLAGDYLSLAPTIRAVPLDMIATSIAIPVWRVWWPDGVKAQVIAWYGKYACRLYTREGLAAFVWIFGGDLTTWGAIIDYWETDPIGTVGTTAAVPSSPLAYTDEEVLSYIAEWMPLGRTLTLDSSAAFIAGNNAVRQIIVTIPSGDASLVPIGTTVTFYLQPVDYIYGYTLVSLAPTDSSTVFVGIIRSAYPQAGASAAVSNPNAVLYGVDPADATAVMDTTIPDGILQRSYDGILTANPALVSGREGWPAVELYGTGAKAKRVIRVFDNDGDDQFSPYDIGAIWTANGGGGPKFAVFARGAHASFGDLYGFVLTFEALEAGTAGNLGITSLLPDLASDIDYTLRAPESLRFVAYGCEPISLPAIPAIPPLGTIIPMPPLATAAPIPQTDAEYYKSAIQSVPNVACAQVYIDGNAVTIRPLMLPDYRVGDASTITAVQNYFNVFGFALGSHTITCKNLNATNKTVSLSVLLDGVSVADFEAFAIPIARAYVSALGASACDAEGSSVTLSASGLATAIEVAYGDDSRLQYIYATSSDVRYPAASTAVVYTSDGYTYVPNGLAVDNGVGVILAFTYS